SKRDSLILEEREKEAAAKAAAAEAAEPAQLPAAEERRHVAIFLRQEGRPPGGPSSLPRSHTGRASAIRVARRRSSVRNSAAPMAAASGEAGRLSRAGPVGCLSAAALSRAADRRAGE